MILVKFLNVGFSRVYIFLRSDELHFKHNFFVRDKVEVKFGKLEFLCFVAKPEYSALLLGFDVFLYPCSIDHGAFIVRTVCSIFIVICLPLNIASNYLLHREFSDTIAAKLEMGFKLEILVWVIEHILLIYVSAIDFVRPPSF
jgi:hypothetical protein